MDKKQSYQNSLSIAYYCGFNRAGRKAINTKSTTKFTPFLTLGAKNNIINYDAYTATKIINTFNCMYVFAI